MVATFDCVPTEKMPDDHPQDQIPALQERGQGGPYCLRAALLRPIGHIKIM